MVIYRVSRIKYVLFLIIGLIIGFIIGFSTLCVIVSYTMDMQYQKIAMLEGTLQDKNDKLKKLEKSINNKDLVLKDIKIYLTGKENDIDNIDIEKTIKEKYKSLVGKEIKNIDAELLLEVVDKRVLKIGDREYKLRVEKLILTEILKIWVQVDKKDNNYSL